MKRCRLFSALALAASLLVFNTSCEIGLGASVDIAAPTVSVTYPEQSSVIRDTFVMAGDCDDDKSVAEVSIEILRTDTGKSQTVKTLKVPADNVNGKWSANINEWLGDGKGYNGWELCDGKYVANVTAIDNTGRGSGTASLSFDIDNTAPILILKSPTSEKISSPYSYGTTFKVTGTLSDDHTVSTMRVDIYGEDADFSDSDNLPEPIESAEEYNIDTTAEIIIANLNREGELQDRYNHLYEGATKGEDKKFWCKVIVQDNAKTYKKPGETENTSTGNFTENFYITDKVSNIWTSGDMDPGRVKKIVNGTATNITETLANQVLDLYNNSSSNLVAFSINSDADPTYEISSYGFAKDEPISKLATKSAVPSITLAYGRNQDNILPETLKVFLWGPYEENELTETEIDKIFYSGSFKQLEDYYKEVKETGKARVIGYFGAGTYEGKQYMVDGVPVEKGYDNGSKDNYTATIEIEDNISANKYYYLSVYAEDLNGKPVVPKSYLYGFKGQSNGGAPEIHFQDFSIPEAAEAGTSSVEDTGVIGAGAIDLYGWVSYPDGVESATAIKYTVTRTEGDTTLPEIKGTASEVARDTSNGFIYWKIPLAGIAADAPETVQKWKITVTTESTSSNGVADTKYRSFQVDTQKPVLTFTSLGPQIVIDDKAYLNGTITVEGKIEDKNPSRAWYEIYSNGDIDPKYTSADYDENTRSISETIDTTLAKFNLADADDKELYIKFWAEDKAGNKNFVETKTLNNGENFILSQATDKPKIEPNFDVNEAGTEAKDVTAWYAPNTELSFSVSDDDGLASITGYRTGAANQTMDLTVPKYKLPATDGVYSIKVTAVDSTYASASATYKPFRTSDWGYYVVGVDTAAPKVTDNSSKGTHYTDYVKTDSEDKPFVLTGLIVENNGIKEIEVKAVKKGASEAAKTYTLSDGTVTFASGEWSVTVNKADGLTDGEYTFTTTATDYADKTGSASSNWIIDTVNPAVSSASITTTSKTTIDTVKWYANTTIAIEATVTDATSGVSKVEYSTDDSEWHTLRLSGTKWIGNVLCGQDENTIYIRATDKAGHTAKWNSSLTAWVDTIRPETLDFVSLGGVAGDAGKTKMIDGKSDVELVVNAADDGVGINTVQIIKIGATTLTSPISGTAAGSGNYKFIIPQAKLEPKGVVVKVTDKVGNSTEKEVVSLNIDKVAPTLEITSVSPDVTRKSDNKKCLNGIATISGKITEDNLERVYYIVNNDGVEKDLDTDAVFNISSIDTTNYTNNAAFDIVIYAVDKAGNKGSKALKSFNGGTAYIIDQATDIPEVTPSNFTFFDATIAANKKETLPSTLWFNDSGNNKIIGSITDDDYIESVKIVTKNATGSSVVIAETPQSIPTDSTSATFTYVLPTTDGVYQVTVTATDSTYASGSTTAIKANRQNVYGPFLVGVDTAAPEITETASLTTINYKNDEAITLSGKASDGNGIKEIEVKAVSSTVTKTYKLSESKVSLTGDDWTCTIAKGALADGTYKITVTATDYAGKTASVDRNYIIDTVVPVVDNTNTKITTTGSTVDGATWYKNTTINIKAVVTDATSGVANVQYSLNGDEENWIGLKQDSTDTTLWTASVKCIQGTNTIKIKATDKSGLVNDTKVLTAKVDTAAPKTLALSSVTGEDMAVFNGTKMVNGKTAVTFAVEAEDGEGETGISTVKVTKIGTTTLGTAITGTSAGSNKYNFSIPAASLKSGTVTVVAADKAGNETTAEMFTLNLDNQNPDVSISSVTPVVTSGTNKYVNGSIKISGKANDINLERVWYQVISNGTAGAEVDLTDGVEIDLDTTTLAANSTLDVVVYAIDKAGNSSSAKASSVNGEGTILFKVDQNTDRPEIAPSNFVVLDAATKGKTDIDADAWFNNAGNNKLIGSVSDDDVLKSVTIVTKDATGSAVKIASKELIASGSTASSINFNYELPADDGVYQVTIVATDETYATANSTYKPYRTTTVGPFIVGVDTAEPELTTTAPAGINYVTGAIALTGTASDGNGIKEITVAVTDTATSTVKKTYTLSGGKVTLTSGSWTCNIAAGDLTEGNYKITVTATDYANKSISLDRTFVKDGTAPTVTLAVGGTPVKINTTNWYGTNVISITATVTETVSGVAEVEYSTTGADSDWSPLKQSTATTWTANVNCAAQGENKIYVRASDNAGNTGKIQNDYTTVNVDSLAPEVCELVSIDGKEATNKKLVNGKAAVTFVVKALDSETETCTGIKEVKLTKLNTTLGTPVALTSMGSNQYSYTIAKDKLVTGPVAVTIYDQLGKSKEFTLFNIDKDDTSPTVDISDMKDADASTDVIDVNKTITFNGSAGDETELEEVYLYYADAASKPALPAAADQGTVANWTAKGWKNAAYSGSKYAWKLELDTENDLTDKRNLYFYAVAVDTAGNLTAKEYVGTSGTDLIYINQDSDRPKLNLSNLALSEETSEGSKTYTSAKDTDGKFWHTSSSIQGTVEDDDGNVKGVYWSKDGSNWSSNIYAKGSWSITGLEDGAETIYFKVTDASGTDFVSAATGTKGPKIVDSNDQECLGYTGKEVSEILNLKIDTRDPSFKRIDFYTSDNATYDSSKVAEISIGDHVSTTIGGAKKYLFVKIEDADDNGIASVKAVFDGHEATTDGTDWKVINQNSAKTTTVVRFDLSKLTLTTGKKIEDKELVITLKDNANKDSSGKVSFTVDNVSPVVSFTQKQKTVIYGSIENTISGKTDDASNIATLHYQVTNSATKPTSGWKQVAYTDGSGNVSEDNQIAVDNWSLTFDDGTSSETEFHTSTFFEIYKDLTGKDNEAMDALNDNLPMYVWMYAEDEVGNASEPASLELSVIPNADKPTIDITYPTVGKNIGGIVRVTGTTSILRDSVGEVYMQIDPDYVGSEDGSGFASNWESKLTALNAGYTVVATGQAAPYNRAIKVTGTTGWAQTINASHEFDSKVNHGGNEGNRTLGFRVFAVSSTKKRISEAAVTVVGIDPDAPLFGAEEVDGDTGMYLVQYANGASSGTIVARQKIGSVTPSIKGQWYLRGSISDVSGISKATVTLPGAMQATILLDKGSIKQTGWISELGTSSDGKGKNYTLNIPVGSDVDGKFGTLKYEVNITDASESQSGSGETYSVTFDNKAPEFSITTEELDEIVQSNGTYTLTGTVNEDSDDVTGDMQSGFSRVVMYVTKATTDGKTHIVDPMISNGTTGKANREDASTFNSTDKAKDGLYWRTATINKVENGTMTVSKLDNATVTNVAPKVRAGGLCKVDGVIYRIKYVNGTSVVLDDNTVTSSKTTAYFAAGAMVIDNPTVEGGTKTKVYDASKTNNQGKDSVQTAGDGDQMMEGARTVGTETTWTVSIDSTQILDGEVTVHFVAFDVAGNITTDEFTATVKNNAPRLAGVKFGSDLNRDGSITGSEWVESYADMYVQVLQAATNERVNGKKSDGTIADNITVAEKDRLTIKSDIKVIPQVVGGNLGLDWQMTYVDNAGATKTTGKTTFANVAHSTDVVRNYGTDSTADNYKTANDNNFVIYQDTLALLKLNNNVGIDRRSGHENQTLIFTINDKGEDEIQSATINIPVKVLFADGVVPTAKITPFYWKSSTENSLYGNSSSFGHIELPDDWTDTSAGLGNDDPKVSGIVTIEGEARDNVTVNKIEISVDNGANYTTIATRTDSGWTSANMLTLVEDNPDTPDVDESVTYENFNFTAGWYFELVDDYTDTNLDNVVKFKFHWNTRTLISNVTQKDVKFTLRVSDKGSVGLNNTNTALAYTNVKSNTPGSTATSTSNKTDYYKMDVVPYIAKIYTEMAALKKNRESKWTMTSRTARGSYPVRVTRYNQAGTSVTQGETIAFYGFNLNGAQYSGNNLGAPANGTNANQVNFASGKTSYNGVTVNGKYDIKTLNASSISTSNAVALTVNTINTINNINNNNAKGSYTGTLDSSNYSDYAYNRQPNSDNNVELNDDVYFDVWDMNEAAAIPSDGRLEQPYMSIDPLTDRVGFGFVNGFLAFSMGGTNGAVAKPATNTNNNYSYQRYVNSADFCTSAGFIYDGMGRSFGVTAGGESGDGQSDLWSLYTSIWGNYDGNNTGNNGKSRRLEQISQGGHLNIDKQRIKSPALATTVHNNSTNLYIAYYDAINDEVRIRYGNFGSNNTTVQDRGDYHDLTGGRGDATTYESSSSYFTLIAGDGNKSDTKTPGTSVKAGQYVSIAVISQQGNTVDDNVVAVWYDGSTLWYSNNTGAYNNMTNGKRGTWNAAVPVFDQDSDMAKAGEFCKVVTDKNGGVHIAGYDTKNKDLCYAYLPAGKNGRATQSSDFVTCIVDSNGVTGSNLNIDVALNASGLVEPHIGYYSESSQKPKIAYYYGGFTSGTTTIGSGVDDNGNFTGNWEVSLVPTRRTVDMQSNQHNDIGVGLWKNNGVKKNSPNTAMSRNGNYCSVYGNGTSNAVVSYCAVVTTITNVIETAQKR